MSSYGELGLEVVEILSKTDHPLTIPEIRREFQKKDRSHGYDAVRYALKNLENSGMVGQNHDPEDRRYFINEWYQRLGTINAMLTMITKWLDPGGDVPKLYYDFVPEERLRIEYLFALGLTRVYSKLVEALVEKDLYDEEEDPVASGLAGTPWYGDKKEDKKNGEKETSEN